MLLAGSADGGCVVFLWSGLRMWEAWPQRISLCGDGWVLQFWEFVQKYTRYYEHVVINNCHALE